MTPPDPLTTLARETAMKINFDTPTSQAIHAIEAALRHARAEERERCAQIVLRHAIPGHSVCGPGYMAQIAAALRAHGEGEQWTKENLRLRLAERQVERMALCSDHRDKVTGRCIVCVAEERTRREMRAAQPARETP